MSEVGRYHGVADYYDEHLRDFTLASTDVVRRLLRRGPGVDEPPELSPGYRPRVFALGGRKP